MDKLMELTEQCFSVIKQQNKYISSLEYKLSKPNIIYKDRIIYKQNYDNNTVNLFNKYVKEIEKLKHNLKTAEKEIECLKKGYITTQGEYDEQ